MDEKETGYWAIVGKGAYGLWFGIVRASDADITATKSLRLYRSRNIRYWYGRTGGIASLAAHGICGPRARDSRIGDEIESALLLDVSAVYRCSEEATATFLAVVNK